MRRVLAALALAALALPAAAQEPVGITRDVMSVTVETASGPREIARIQDNANIIEDEWGQTSRPCPAFCIQPMIPATLDVERGQIQPSSSRRTKKEVAHVIDNH